MEEPAYGTYQMRGKEIEARLNQTGLLLVQTV
jgi:hypothetical protein